MGTKNDPGDHDCYWTAHPDEPMFVLLGRDRHAPALVRQWARLRQDCGEDPAVVEEALACAEKMSTWVRFDAVKHEAGYRYAVVVGEERLGTVETISRCKEVVREHLRAVRLDLSGIAAGLKAAARFLVAEIKP